MVDVLATFDEHLAAAEAARALAPAIEEAARRMARAIADGGKVLWMGNGGSAADSQHLAAELVGRFCRERPGIASIALTTDSSILTAIGNDYGYERIFERQVEALCRPGDVVVGLTTSGNSPNVLAAIRLARARGAYTVGMTAAGGGRLASECDLCLAVPTAVTARAQEVHILIGHILCDWVEASALGER